MIALRSLLFNVASYSWTFLTAVFAVPIVALLMKPGKVHGGARKWSGGVFVLLKVLCRIDYEIRGLENLPRGPFIVASKHQSAWDTMIFLHLFDRPSYVIKQELGRIPLLGWAMRDAEMVAVDRSGGTKALKGMVAQARDIVEAGRVVVIFPEGTRVAPGSHRPYHPGVAALYKELGVPVVPVGLNSGLFWPRRHFLRMPGTILLEFQPPIAPGLPRREFMKLLEQRVEGSSDRLLAEASSGNPVEEACG